MVEGLQRVVVTGLGAVTPIGNTVADYWEGLTSASNGVEAITLFDAAQHACRFAAEVKNFDPSGFIEPKDAKRWDRFCKFGVVAAKQALADSGLTITPDNAHRIGVSIGSGVGGLLTMETQARFAYCAPSHSSSIRCCIHSARVRSSRSIVCPYFSRPLRSALTM